MVRTARQAGSQQQLRQSLAESSGLRGILPWKHAMLHLQKQKQEILDRAFNAVCPCWPLVWVVHKVQLAVDNRRADASCRSASSKVRGV